MHRYYLCQVSLRLKETGKLSKFGLFFIPQLLIRSFWKFGSSFTPLIRKCAIKPIYMICSSIYRYYLCQVSLRLKEAGKLYQFGLFFVPHLLIRSFFFRIWRLINPSHPEVCNISILSILTRRIKTLSFAIKVSMFMIKYFFWTGKLLFVSN